MEIDEQELLQQLFQLAWILRRYTMQHQRDRGPMASPFQGQGRILALLKLKPEISQKELSTILDIRSQSLGELLAKLERSGFITRTPSEADRRGMEVRLTEAGKAEAERSEAPGRDESFFDCLEGEERAALADYVGRLIKSLESRMEAAGEEAGFGHGFRGRGEGHPFRRGGPPSGREGFDPFSDRGFGPPPREER